MLYDTRHTTHDTTRAYLVAALGEVVGLGRISSFLHHPTVHPAQPLEPASRPRSHSAETQP
jgi:hypothetical protein